MVSIMSPTAIPTGPVPRMTDGNKTSTIYSLIRDQQYTEAIALLTSELSSHPKSRAALSLLSHCYYHASDFQSSSQCYQQLCQLFPDVADYRFHWAQSLYKAGLYVDALSVAQSLSSAADYSQRVSQLTAAIHFDQDNIPDAYTALSHCEADDSTMFARACLLYREKKYDQALDLYTLIQSNSGPTPDLSYALAACHYQLKAYPAALKLLTEHIEKQVKLHPQLAVGARSDADPSSSSPPSVLSVGNSPLLRDSFLIEAFNLKSAIEFTLHSPTHARLSLLDMPPRDLHELDLVTLHNTALLDMESNPSENFKRLHYVLQAGGAHFPREAFNNLLLFYVKYDHYALCSDVLAENGHLIDSLSTETQQFLESTLLIPTNPAEAYRKLETLSATYIERLRKITKSIQDHRTASDTDAIKVELKRYDDTIESYLPLLMTQCKIYWDLHNYEQVEKILKLNAEFVSESDVFKLNVAHCLYMQESKYKESIKYYEFICKKSYHSILAVQPSILANLCVSYIMCSENEEAEELMRLIEKEEEKSTASATTPLPYHLCIVNLVIGTLYCSKGNFEFGISRIIKSFDPLAQKLNVDTWFYAKKNVLSVLEYVAKSMFVMKREFFEEIDGFLTECEKEGKGVKVRVPGVEAVEGEEWKNNVTYEARMLKRLLYKLKE